MGDHMSTVAQNIDLSQFVKVIYDQGTENSCYPNAYCQATMDGALEYGITLPKLSAQYVYNAVNIVQGSPGADIGSALPFAWGGPEKYGVVPESISPYGPQYLSGKLPEQVQAMGVTLHTDINPIGNYVTLGAEIGEQLMRGKVVMVDAYVHSDIYSLTGSYADMSAQYSNESPVVGIHEFDIVGRQLIDGQYVDICVNSWGSGYGNHGFFAVRESQLLGVGSTSPTGQDVIGLAVLNGCNGVNTTWTPERMAAAQEYLIFGRTADHAGDEFWANQIKGGMSIAQVSDAFISSGEGQSIFGGLNDTQFVALEYQNILGRTADAPGLALWVSHMQSTHETRGQFVAEFMNCVAGANNSDTDAMHNRADVSGCGAITYQDAGQHYAANVAALVGVSSDANAVPGAELAFHKAIYGF